MTSLTETLNSSARKWRKRAEFENAGHADDLFGLEAGELLQRPHHRVERVGDADHEGVGRMLLDAVADGFHDLEVDADEVVAAHAGLAGHARRHDDHVRAGDVRVIVGALVLGVEAVDRRGFGDVETLALGNAFRDVEQHDVAEFLQADQMGERAADLASTDERDLVTGHEMSLSVGEAPSLLKNVALFDSEMGHLQANKRVNGRVLPSMASGVSWRLADYKSICSNTLRGRYRRSKFCVTNF